MICWVSVLAALLVPQAIHRLWADPQDYVHRPSCFNKKHDRAGGERGVIMVLMKSGPSRSGLMRIGTSAK